MAQNYFQYNNTQCKQVNGIVIGGTTSVILSKIFLRILYLLNEYQIIRYSHYVDIVIAYNIYTTNVENIVAECNKLYSSSLGNPVVQSSTTPHLLTGLLTAVVWYTVMVILVYCQASGYKLIIKRCGNGIGGEERA
jgi:hypothetical protein